MSNEEVSFEAQPPDSEDSFAWKRNLDGWARALFDGIDDAVFVHDLRGRILDANAAACRRLGYTREELLEMNTSEIDDPEFAKDFASRLDQQMADGGLRCVGKHLTKDGQSLLVDINSSAITFDGKPCVLSVMRDITEQVRIEKTLREQQAFYHSLVESLPQNLFRKDREGKVTFANNRYCKLLGKSLDDLRGKTDFDLFPEHLASKYVADDQKVLTTGKALQMIEEHLAPGGEVLHVEVIKTPIFDSRGRIIGTQGLFWDVTRRVLAEQAVAASEKSYRQLTESTLDAIIVADYQGNIALFNPAAAAMFGYEADEIKGESLAKLLPDPFLEAVGEEMLSRLRHRNPPLLGKPTELQGIHKDGAAFPIEMVLTAIEAEGKPPRNIEFLGAVRDLTERNRMRSNLIQSEKLASIGLLSAGVAHEINNPLAFIGNNLAVLDRDMAGILELIAAYEKSLPELEKTAPATANRLRELAEEADLEYFRDNIDRLLTRTRDGVDRVARIVQNLRGMARTGKPERQMASIPDLIDSNLEIVRNRINRAKIEVTTEYAPDPHVHCVATQISQVLLNLIINAVQAVEAMQRDAGKLHFRVERGESEILIEIRDNGGGIAPDHLERIFDPFYTTKDVGEGTGLGLSISHYIITAHGGRILADSTVGEGTSFQIYLPLITE